MNISHCKSNWLASVVLVAFLALSPVNWAADEPATLKEAFAKHFMVGAALNRSMVMGGGAFRRTPEQIAKDVALVKRHFNQITAENDMKWALIHPREGQEGYDFGPADAFVDFGVSNSFYLVGHTLVWHSQTPNWVFAGTNPPPATATNSAPGARRQGFGRYDGPRASREELLERMRDHIHTVVGRYKGKIKSWDVVNEAIADGDGTNVLRNSLWLEIIGPDYIAKAFEYAHEADPEAILRYNDYGLENPAKRRKLVTLIKTLQEQKVPIHAIGSQAHVNVAMTFETMDQALTEMKVLGLPIHITELDVNAATGGQRRTDADVAANSSATQGGLVAEADRKLADAYAGIFRAFLKHRDSVEMVTFWGVNDAVSWRRQGRPLLFDGENEPKPAFHSVIRTASENTPKAP
jgi:endo-1,4-beta-xylanase